MHPDAEPSGAGPNRGRLIAIFSGLATLGLVLGVGAAQLTASGNNSALIGATPATASTAAPIDPSASDPPESPEPSSTPSPTPVRNYRAIPQISTSERGLDFGFLTRVSRSAGKVTLAFDRANFYTGAEAKKRNKGKVPDSEYLITNTNPKQRTFELDPKASIIAANALLNETGTVGREPLTLEEFVANSVGALAESGNELPVWLRHTDGLNGPVTALAEQYLP